MSKKLFKSNPHPFLDPDEVLMDSVSALGSFYGSETKIERPISKVSYVLFLLMIGAGILYLISRAGTLQIKSGETFFAEAQENRFLVRSVSSPRGIIFDQFGEVLVENHPSFGIVFDKEEFLAEKENLSDILEKLTKIFKQDKSYFYEIGFPQNNEARRLPKRIVIAEELSPEQVLSVSSALHEIRGIQIFENFRRVYKEPFAFSHLLGFVGKVSERDLATNPQLAAHETIGKNGIENEYDALLRGREGKKIVEIDAAGKETRFKLVEEPEKGTDLVLTIDGGLQKKIYETIAHYVQGRKGASAVAVDPRDGSIRALVSYPGFQSNRFGHSLSSKEFENVLNDPLRPLFNRAISGEFPSGSTIKPMVAAAALEEKIIEPSKQIYDPGYIEIPNPYFPGEVSRFVDWRPNPKPRLIDLYDAIAFSANVYFYTVGGGFKEQKGLGIDRLKKYALAFGLGSELGIDIPGEKSGLFPDPEWKKAADSQNPVWRIGDTYNVSIGQGGVKTTPLQMAMLTSAIANGGALYHPHIYSALKEGQEEKEKSETKIIRKDIISKEVLAHVVKAMRKTVTSGTARLLAGLPIETAAKTGTAEAGSGLPHAWVTVFTPAENPELVLVVMVEHAGEGSTVAVPITNEVLQWYSANRKIQ